MCGRQGLSGVPFLLAADTPYVDVLMNVSKEPNRLAKEKSPYLLQHAYNPVDWYPWGEEAFARAREEAKPIFLSIGYSTCHWCHVMEHESFENETIAALLNELFVPVKVDREERPDVDRVYMSALQAMGQSGGWPMSMFLTPDTQTLLWRDLFPPGKPVRTGGVSRGLAKASRHLEERTGESVRGGGTCGGFSAGNGRSTGRRSNRRGRGGRAVLRTVQGVVR